MNLVAAFACSHAGLMLTRKGRGDEAAEAQVYDAFARMGRELRAAAPDAVIVFATDHQTAYKLDHIPAFTIGVSSTARGLGDAGVPATDYPINQDVAQRLLEGALQAGVDLAFSEDMTIDHSFVTPLRLALGQDTVPIVPVVQNCNVPPRPTPVRSLQVGRVFADVLAEVSARVAVIGTGGLSHWVGSPQRQAFMRRPAGTRLAAMHEYPVTLEETGPINQEFDEKFLAAAGEGRWGEIASWSFDDVEQEAGNGTQEIRNWLSAAGVAAGAPARPLAYQAVPQWLTGTAVTQFEL
jgi:aromatic ring-opening dioxygenase catalytic subunit (LigB family)